MARTAKGLGGQGTGRGAGPTAGAGRLRRTIGLLLAWAALAAVTALAVPLSASANPADARQAAPPAEEEIESVPGQPVVRPTRGPNPEAAPAPAPEALDLPEPEVAQVAVDATLTEAGATPVSVSDPQAEGDAADAPDEVTVEVLPADDVKAVGPSGFAFTVERADDGTDEAPVGLQVDYDGFRDAYGGDFASRVVLEQYPACVLDTPEDPACSTGTIVPAENDVERGTLTVDATADPVVADPSGTDPEPGGSTTTTSTTSTTQPDSSTTVPDGATTTTEDPASTTTTEAGAGTGAAPDGHAVEPVSLHTARAPATGGSSGGTVFALSTGVSGSTGTYAATSLSQAQRWQSGGSSGAASWSYPIDVPAATVGPTPSLALTYSSQAVDAMTPASNSQPGLVGLGWDLSGLGFIERRYRSCSQDDTGWIIADLCWRSNNATISMNGVSSELIPTATSGIWQIEDDPGWKVEHLFSGSNGDDNDEYWVVTTTDGTQYWYGYGLARGGTATNSTWTAPVFGNGAGEPCHGSTVDTSWCQQAWRWNLDRVVDPNDDFTNVYWQDETNNYGRELSPGLVTPYDRGGYPTKIEYGRAHGSAETPEMVLFNYSDRCTASMTGGSCPTPSASNASQFPDVPADLMCSGTSCDDYSPSFFTTKRLNGIFTATKSAGTWRMVDRFALTQLLPDNGDSSDPKLWLDKIQRYADPTYSLLAYTGTNKATPPVELDGILKANRADSDIPNGVGPANLRRLAVVSEELGALTFFTYDQPNGHKCDDKNGPWDKNDQYCFPVYFKPDGGNAGWAANNKYVVTKVESVDGTGGSPTQTTTYSYDDAPAWHHNEDDVAPAASQTWADYRGHSKVTVTTGASRTTYLYFRGMDGNKQTGAPDQSASITDQLGDSVTDSDWLAGRLREERHLEGASSGDGALTATIHDYEAPAGPTSGQHTVHQVREIHARSRTALSSGGSIDTQTNTAYDSHGMVTSVHDLGDTSAGGDERCTQYQYSQNTTTWMLDRVGRTQLSANCSTPYTTVADTYYDGATSTSTPPVAGNATSTIAYSDAALTPAKASQTTTAYDAYGRVKTAVSPRGKTTATSYYPTDNRFTESVSVTAPLGMSTTTTLSARRGQPEDVTDQNGHVVTSAYDEFGRLSTVHTPQDGAGQYSYKFGYEVTKDWESKVHSYRRLGSGYVDTWTLVDSFGRTR